MSKHIEWNPHAHRTQRPIQRKSEQRSIQNEEEEEEAEGTEYAEDEHSAAAVGCVRRRCLVLLLYACTIGLHAKVIITPVSAIYLHSKSRYFMSFALSCRSAANCGMEKERKRVTERKHKITEWVFVLVFSLLANGMWKNLP